MSSSAWIDDNKYGVFAIIIHYIVYCVLIICMMLAAFDVNKTVLKCILRTFIFWVEVLYGIKYLICSMIYRWKKWGIPPRIILWCGVTMVLLESFGLRDGINMPLRAKIIFGSVGTIYFIWMSFYWTFLLNEPCIMYPNWWNSYASEYDMREWTASSVRVVTIFMCRQMIHCIWKLSYATLINKSMKIVWLR